MSERHGGLLLMECLLALGASRGFGVPGESYLAVLDGLYDVRDRFDLILCRNEGGAAFMAAAHGKLTGDPGLCFVTRGPGATNASIGVHTAMQDSVPMILFVGQVETGMRDREAFQEIDYRAFFGPVAKWVTEIDDVDRIPEILSRAWTTAIGGRPGPVVVSLPEDMLASRSSKAPLAGPVKVSAPTASESVMRTAREMISSASRPVILIGGASWTDTQSDALKSFAEATDIPVVAAFRYQDRFDNNSPAYVGDAGVGMLPAVRQTLHEADLILALGVRFGEITTDGFTLFDLPKMTQTLIHVHASDRELGKIYQPDLAVHASPGHFAEQLAMHPISGDWGRWRSARRAAYESTFELPVQPGPVDMSVVMTHLRRRLPADSILTNGAGNFAVWPNKYFRFGAGQRLLAPQSGAMGYGLPAAIAARLEHPERTVVCFAGDGDFQMNMAELGSGMQAGALPVVLILNNGSYGTIRMHQERQYPARVSGTDLENPDFVALAKAYGMYGERIENTHTFEDSFERALASPTGAILDLVIGKEALTPRQTLSQIREAATETKS